MTLVVAAFGDYSLVVAEDMADSPVAAEGSHAVAVAANIVEPADTVSRKYNPVGVAVPVESMPIAEVLVAAAVDALEDFDLFASPQK
mmetsp:Transcript_24227/g.31645  ORF Transcript_24227/g.31645 Transcript_24227/m.31645 type:complete len:87 (-) Transcript_24227:1908-2168(-)